MIQRSFKDEKPALYLVPTPIGNLSDMTYRSVETLHTVHVIFSEDTRVTRKLCQAYEIKTPIRRYNEFEDIDDTHEIIRTLEEGKDIALVSDAGYPLISDPGQKIVQQVVGKGYHVIALPGATATLPALIASGCSSYRFQFYGFLKPKEHAREKELLELSTYEETLIFFIQPSKAVRIFEQMYACFGERNATLCRELTKIYETYDRTTLSELTKYEDAPKGELVLIVEGKNIDVPKYETRMEMYDALCQEGVSKKEAMKRVAKAFHVSKSDIYAEVLETYTP